MKSKFLSSSYVAITSVVSNILMTIFMLVYNKLVIVHYGSSVTGLISTLTQFVTMFTVIEGGFSLAAVVAAYRPILEDDHNELNSILFTAKKYFNRIAVIYLNIVMVCGVVYVYFLHAPVGFLYAVILLSLTTVTTTLSISGLAKYTVVFSGHNRQYVTIIISTICKTVTWIISIVLILKDADIILVYSLNVINIILNIYLMKYYERKNYPYITYKGSYDLTKIKGVKDIMFQKLASTVFTSTDLVLVSVGLSLSKASVYFIYNQIFQGVYQYLSALSSAPTDSFGHLLKSGEDKNAQEKFLIYKKTINIFSTAFFSAASVMIIPFLQIYTRNVEDENYIIPGLAVMFFLYNYLKINNLPYGMIINVSGEFEKQNKQTGFAAVANLAFSLLFMKKLGLNGIVLGSAIGTFIIITCNIIKAKEILFFDEKRDIFSIIINFMLGMSFIYSSRFIDLLNVGNYLSWALAALTVLILLTGVVFAVNYAFDFRIMNKCMRYYILKMKRKHG